MMKWNIISMSVFQFFVDSSYQKLKNDLIDNNLFIEDVFHETLLNLNSEIMYDLDPSLTKLNKLFKSTYKINLGEFYSERRQYILFDQQIMDFIQSSNNI